MSDKYEGLKAKARFIREHPQSIHALVDFQKAASPEAILSLLQEHEQLLARETAGAGEQRGETPDHRRWEDSSGKPWRYPESSQEEQPLPDRTPLEKALLEENRVLLAELSRSREEQGWWIDCKQELPPRSRVLVYFPSESTSVMDALFDGQDFHVDGFVRTKAVTHWRPLPTPPDSRKDGSR